MDISPQLDQAITQELNQRINIMADHNEVKGYQHMHAKGGEMHHHGDPAKMGHPTRGVAMAPMGPSDLGSGNAGPAGNDHDADDM